MVAQRYVHDILQPHVFLLMAGSSGAILQQDNVPPHAARVSQNPSLACLIPRFVTDQAHLELLKTQVGHSMSLDKLRYISSNCETIYRRTSFETCMSQCPIISHHAFMLEIA
ncbi:hypothetical protein TNCV_2906441 [Trichonephila clavipes]|nr:hypothetical protein TNCV_2906441 [Trichonephila clavipes]